MTAESSHKGLLRSPALMTTSSHIHIDWPAVLACPFDSAWPLNAALVKDGRQGLLQCPQCQIVFAVINAVPHMTRAQLREIDLERRMVGRHGHIFPADWTQRLAEIWAEADATRTPQDQRLIDEGRYWGEYFQVHADHNALTILDARCKGTHPPYLGYGSLAIDDRDRFRVHDHWPNPVGRRILAFFDETHASGARRYLDFACGGGQFGLEACYRRAQSIGFDLATAALELGEAYAREHRLDAHYVRAEPTALPFRPGFFDAMVVKDGLHHLPDVGAALHSAQRVLKPAADVLLMDHVAEKPRWEALLTKIIHHYIHRILSQYPSVDGPQIFKRLSPCEFAGMDDLEEIIREHIDIVWRRGEMLFCDEMTLPVYLAKGRKWFPAEPLSKLIYLLEKTATLWGRPRFVFLRGNMKKL